MTFAEAANVIFDKAVVIGLGPSVLIAGFIPALYAGIPLHKHLY